MMGQHGLNNWINLSQQQIWKRRAVRGHFQKPLNRYKRAIQYLEQDAINTVPKALHFIWMGPRPFPENSTLNLISWKERHPSWNFFFWTDKPERSPPLEGVHRRLISDLDLGQFQRFFEESDNWSEKSDLIRFMIMYKEGGIYVDHDVKCIRALDPLSSHYDFVAGYEPLHPNGYTIKGAFVPNTGLIISRPHHPIMKRVIERLSARWDIFAKKYPGQDRASVACRVLMRTFDPFAHCVSRFIEDDEYRNIILPASYFHSAHCFEKNILDELTEQGHVYAIHYLDGSWLPQPPAVTP
jgi:mannosyltransferase OCH1-like enzyme